MLAYRVSIPLLKMLDQLLGRQCFDGLPEDYRSVRIVFNVSVLTYHGPAGLHVCENRESD